VAWPGAGLAVRRMRARRRCFAVALAAGLAGAMAAAVPYIGTLAGWTTPGLSVIPVSVAWWPAVSVSRTVNGPAPAPPAASQ
jgi:hypothetical protein